MIDQRVGNFTDSIRLIVVPLSDNNYDEERVQGESKKNLHRDKIPVQR